MNLNQENVKLGRLALTIGVGIVILLQLVGLLILVTQLGAGRVDSLFYSSAALVIVAGLGTIRGSKIIRYVFAFLLMLIAVGYLLAMFSYDEMPPAMLSIVVFEAIVHLGVIYLVMFDNRVQEFLIYQQSRNYGRHATVAPTADPVEADAAEEAVAPTADPVEADAAEEAVAPARETESTSPPSPFESDAEPEEDPEKDDKWDVLDELGFTEE